MQRKKFEDLVPSTITVMAYTNMSLNIPEIFKVAPITKIDAPLTKKKQRVDKKKISVASGDIISVQTKIQFRGIDTRKKKLKWCSICRPVDEDEQRIYTVIEKSYPNPNSDIINIRFYCNRCKKEYDPSEQKQICHFLNQVAVILSLGNQPLVNIMIFKDSLKIAGCKRSEDALEVIKILWAKIFNPFPNTLVTKDGKDPTIIFETVMKNRDFKLGFFVDREKLNDLMNDEKYSDKIFTSDFETTAHNNVNIKMYTEKPRDFKYSMIVIKTDGKHVVMKQNYTSTNPLKTKKEKIPRITFIVFSTFEIIISGKYDKSMKKMYEFFIKLVEENREMLEEKIMAKPKLSLVKEIL